MANEQRGETSIKLGGAEYALRPTFDALAEMESDAGCGIIVLMRRFLKASQGGTFDFSTKDVLAVIEAGIRASGGEVPKNLGALILQTGLVDVANIAANFLANALAGDKPSGNAGAPQADQ